MDGLANVRVRVGARARGETSRGAAGGKGGASCSAANGGGCSSREAVLPSQFKLSLARWPIVRKSWLPWRDGSTLELPLRERTGSTGAR